MCQMLRLLDERLRRTATLQVVESLFISQILEKCCESEKQHLSIYINLLIVDARRLN